MSVLGSLICEGFFSEWPTTNFMTRSREMNLISNHLWNVFMISMMNFMNRLNSEKFFVPDLLVKNLDSIIMKIIIRVNSVIF